MMNGNLCLHGIGDEALPVGCFVEPLQIRRRGHFFPAEDDFRIKRDGADPHGAGFIFGNDANGFVFKESIWKPCLCARKRKVSM